MGTKQTKTWFDIDPQFAYTCTAVKMATGPDVWFCLKAERKRDLDESYKQQETNTN